MSTHLYDDKQLTPEQRHILRDKGTEAPFSGKYINTKDNGMYKCALCGTELFSSDTKFESGTGWPSFYDVAKSGNVKLVEDKSMGTVRTEVVCSTCGGHLGHVFNDGPQLTPDGKECTGLRYCINSGALDFKEK